MNQQTIGQRLSGAREAIRASLFQASQDTKIRVDFLQAMENDDFDFVSGGPYVRGMLRSYVRWLGLEEAPILADFDRLNNVQPQPSISEMMSRPPEMVAPARRPQWLIAAAAAGGLLVILSIIGLVNPSSEVAQPPMDPVGDQARSSPEPAVAVEDPIQSPSPPAFEGVNVAVAVTGNRVWMNVQNAQEESLFVGTLNEGEERTFQADEMIRMRIGDLGAVNLTVNGNDLGAPGASGQVATIELTPGSMSFAQGTDQESDNSTASAPESGADTQTDHATAGPDAAGAPSIGASDPGASPAG